MAKAEAVLSEQSPTRTPYMHIVPLAFFTGMFVYVGLIIEPTLIYHAFARFIDYPQFQMTGSFLAECLSRPGGFLEYTHGFLSQWFYYSWAGAVIITVLAWAVHACVAALPGSSQGLKLRILPYLPALALIVTYNRHQHGLAYFLALLYALLATMLYRCAGPAHRLARTLVFAVLVCALYYLIGSFCLLFTILALAQEALCRKYRLSIVLYPVLTAAGIGLIGMLCFGLEGARAFLWLPPFSGAPIAVVDRVSGAAIIAAYLTAPVSLLLGRLPKRLVKKSPSKRKARKVKKTSATRLFRSPGFRLGATLTVLAAGVCITVGLSYDRIGKHVLRVNYLARKQMWSELLACRAPVNMPYNEHCRHDTIRALCQTGRMADELFARDPSATALLLASDPTTFTSSVSYAKRSELMLALGHVGIAEKNAYEQLQEEGPCPFILERLAVIHLAKGNHAIARVFLNALSQDLIHRHKARQLLHELKKSPEMTTDPVIQQLRRNASDRDNVNYRFAEGFFLQLLEKNPANQVAFEYMMAHHLLHGRVHLIARNIHRLKDFGYTRLPRHYEEALAIYLTTSGEKIDLGPWTPGPEALGRIAEFTAQYKNAGGLRNKAAAQRALWRGFGGTFTFYYAFAAPGEAG